MIPDRLAPILQPIAAALAPDAEADALVPTGNPQHGDYQWNFALKIAKAQKQNPRALAERIRQELIAAAPAAIARDAAGQPRVEVAGPGFLNITLDEAWLCAELRAQVERPEAGVPQSGAGPDGAAKTVIIDFSSPNVAKRMHIGHMRSTQIGHALYRLHRAAGWRVIGDNHIGDWGTQFGMLFYAWKHHRATPELAAETDAAFAEDPVGELERLYVWFRQQTELPEPKVLAAMPEEAQAGLRAQVEARMEAARAETARLQQGDPENTALWQRFIAVSLEEFNAVYRRMGVTFDEVLGESAYNDRIEGIVSGLLADGIAEHSQGAVIVRFDEPALKAQVMMVRKRDGAANYAATDLGCIRYRQERWSPDKVIYVTDKRQQLHFQQLFAVAKRWNIPTELVHSWFGTLTLPMGLMSSRKGNVIRLVDMLDEAARRARAVVDQKSPMLPEEERARIAEAVGVSAIRYADLSQNPQTDVAFEWDRMLSLEGNTAPYLMYAHARCVSLLAKAAGLGLAPDLQNLRISEGGKALERELVIALLRLPEGAATALRTARPNVFCDHLYELASRFSRFYYALDVIEGGADRDSRLALVEASRRALRWGMELLGLQVIDRM